MAAVPEFRGDRILLTAHTDEDAAAHVAGEDEETARRFGWWPKAGPPGPASLPGRSRSGSDSAVPGGW